VDGRAEELLARGVDVVGQRRQRERHRAVEGVVQQQLRADHVAGRDRVVELEPQRAADLLAQEAELDHDVGRAEPLLNPAAGVRLGGVQDGRVVERGWRVDPARRGPAQQRHDRVEQRRDVLSDRQLAPVVVERLAGRRVEPALEDVGPTGAERLGDPAQVRALGEALDPRLDPGGAFHWSAPRSSLSRCPLAAGSGDPWVYTCPTGGRQVRLQGEAIRGAVRRDSRSGDPL
jgi:hypothetical protein